MLVASTLTYATDAVLGLVGFEDDIDESPDAGVDS
jgi:hypothetical protein